MKMTDYYNIITANLLFDGMSRQQAEKALKLLDGRILTFEKGEFVHPAYRRHERFGLVLSGSVQVCCDSVEGNKIIMAEVGAGNTFGESLCCLKAEDSPVYITALEKSVILSLSLNGIFSGGENGAAEMQRRFTALLASRTLSMNNRIQILSRISIREKLIVYFNELVQANRSNTFTVPMNRENLAAYIGTNRSALSRELSRMKKDGLIDYKKNSFTLFSKK